MFADAQGVNTPAMLISVPLSRLHLRGGVYNLLSKSGAGWPQDTPTEAPRPQILIQLAWHLISFICLSKGFLLRFYLGEN